MTNETAGSDTTAMTDEQRDEVASKLVDRFSLWSGAAGLVPIPLVDIAAVGGVQIQMLRRLSEIYGVPFSDNVGKSVIASFAGSIIPASTATTAAMGVGSFVKGLPGIGTAIGAITMPVISAVPPISSARSSSSISPRAGRCSISILRIIASSSRLRKRS